MSYYRDLGPLAYPLTQADLVQLTGYTEVPIGSELHIVHHGEDGLGYELQCQRAFLIDEQALYSGEFQDWYIDECWETGAYDD